MKMVRCLSVSNARTIIAAREKDVFMSFVEASKSEMSEQEYQRIRKESGDRGR